MITEDYVSFETAKLLKEKGFYTDDCISYYDEHKKINVLQTFGDLVDFDEEMCILAPTLQMAMKWLREEHGLVAVVDYEYEYTDTSYYYKIYQLGVNGKPERIAVKGAGYNELGQLTEHIVMYRDYKRSSKEYHTYEKACEAAIRDCLENLI